MILLDGGRTLLGSERFYPEEGPVREVVVEPFALDRDPVTNDRFAAFVSDTGHVTMAETVPDPRLYPGVPQERLVPASAVFVPPKAGSDVDLSHPTWWSLVPGACWSAPEGPGSDLMGRGNHPAVHVAYDDAVAFARWAGARLPSEAEWEYAARGGLVGAAYAWGDRPRQGGVVPAAVWEGDFPIVEPGAHLGTRPVGAFGSHGFGLRDLIGNVWEWTSDSYTHGHLQPCCGDRTDPLALGRAERVLKGGSFLCADNYCHRYRPAARIPQSEDSSAANVGFRCASDR